MQFFKRFLDFYIQSSIHVGIAVMALVYVTQFSGSLEIDSVYACSVFFGTVLSYNFLKYVEVFRRSGFHSKTFQSILIVTVLAVIGFFFFFLELKRNAQIHLAISGILVILYPLIRKCGWLKLFFVSVAVTNVTVYIPYLLHHSSQTEILISVLQRFFITTSLLIPFEIMDSKTDTSNMKTLPRMIGIARAKVFGILLLVPFVVLEFIKQSSSYTVLPIGMITALFIHFTFLTRTKYYTSFWLESVPIFWLLLLLLFQ
jgi:hypothetical protein